MWNACTSCKRRHEAQLRADVVVLINELNVQEDDRSSSTLSYIQKTMLISTYLEVHTYTAAILAWINVTITSNMLHMCIGLSIYFIYSILQYNIMCWYIYTCTCSSQDYNLGIHFLNHKIIGTYLPIRKSYFVGFSRQEKELENNDFYSNFMIHLWCYILKCLKYKS